MALCHQCKIRLLTSTPDSRAVLMNVSSLCSLSPGPKASNPTPKPEKQLGKCKKHIYCLLVR